MITQQSDIYSLGIILFEMLTGRVPYDGETAVSIALKHYRSQMPSPRSFKQDIPQALENIVLHATAKDCTDRYQNVEEMQADLATCLDENEQLSNSGVRGHMWKKRLRSYLIFMMR